MNEVLIGHPDFITADTHFLHRNIVKYSGRPDNHDEVMIKAWNSVVKPSSTILHLGDLVWWGEEIPAFSRIAERLNGEKFLIKGNHDNWSDQQYLNWGFKVIDPYRCTYNKDWIVKFHHYSDPKKSGTLYDDEILFHGHVHNNYDEHSGLRKFNVGVDLWWGRPLVFEDAVNKVINRVEYMKRKDK